MEMKWIPIEEEEPTTDDYVLISFLNYPGLDIGRYEADDESGTFYPGDEDTPYGKYGLIVNAWMPLPERYTEEEI